MTTYDRAQRAYDNMEHPDYWEREDEMNGSYVFDEFMKSGLHSEIGHNEFSKEKCENCGGLPGERFTISGYFNLKHAREGESYEIEICIDCYEKLMGGE
jgi:hypothetical protein